MRRKREDFNKLLTYSSFRNYFVGQCLSMAGDAICLATLPVALLTGAFDVGTFGVIMAAVGLGSVFGAAAGGHLADGRSAKKILALTDICRGMAQLFAAALIFFEFSWLPIAFVYLLFGAAIGVSRPCAQVLLVGVLPREMLATGNSAMNFVDNLTAVVFPATIGVMLILYNPLIGIVVDAITFLVACYFTLIIPEAPTLGVKKVLRISDWLRGINAINDDGVLRVGLVATLIINVLCFPVFLILTPFLISARFDNVTWGWCLAASGMGACGGSVLAVFLKGHDRINRLGVACAFLLSAAFMLLATTEIIWVAVVAAVLVGVVEASWLTAWATVVQIRAPGPDLGKVVAVDTILTTGMHPLIYIGSGFFASLVGYPAALILIAILAAAGGIFISIFSLFFIGRGEVHD